MADRFTFICSDFLHTFSYGTDHPFKALRYRLALDLISDLGYLDNPKVDLVPCPETPESYLLSFHCPEYLETLRLFSSQGEPRANFLYGLGDVENPVFPGVYDLANRLCGGTLEAALRVAQGRARVAFNMTGGCHHAHAARASGFSYLNDAVVAIHALLARGLRVAYVDLDAHHGDGVQAAFYDTDRALTISLHEAGADFFPFTGYTRELGVGAGYGYSINVPFSPHSDDLIFEQAFKRIVLPLLKMYRPDVLVTQMGVDAMRTDPLTRLEMTTNAFEYAARSFLDSGIPWVVLGGGGYDKFNVARAWAIVWGTILGETIPDSLPPRFQKMAREKGFHGNSLRDRPHMAHPDDFARAQSALDRNLDFLERKVFPLHAARRRAG